MSLVPKDQKNGHTRERIATLNKGGGGRGAKGFMMTCVISKLNSWMLQNSKISKQTEAYKLNNSELA